MLRDYLENIAPKAKPKPIGPSTHDFSRALSRLPVIATNSDWFIALFAPVVIRLRKITLVIVFQQSFQSIYLHCALVILYYLERTD